MLGTVTGPHPFPEMVRDFHRVIGVEARQQVLDLVGRLPDVVLRLRRRRLQRDGHLPPLHRRRDRCASSGFEAGGEGVESGKHAARFSAGIPGVLHGAFTYVLQDEDGQTVESHSVSAGLDYPSVGPEHAHLLESGRAEYRPITDVEAMEAFSLLSRTEGILPAIESSARPRRRDAGRARARPRRRPPRQPLGPRRQGRPHGRAVVRPHRRRTPNAPPDEPGAKGMGEQL